MVLLSIVLGSVIIFFLSIVRIMSLYSSGCFPVSTMAELLTIFNWNVCGLNSPARRDVVRDMVQSAQPKLVCLQETKLVQISSQVAA
jgi:hypothetical protein